MAVAFDNTILSVLLKANARVSNDPATGNPIELARERVLHLVSKIQKQRGRIVIPTPITAELLTEIGPNNADYLRIINRAKVFEVKAFDEVAAIELAFMNRDIFADQDKNGKLETRQKVKVDRQFLAVAKVAGCTIIYTDDRNLQNRAILCEIEAKGLIDLPIPDSARQKEFDYEEYEAMPDIDDDSGKGD